MKVRPLGDKLIIKRADPQTRTDSGIYLPESAKDKPKEGKVVALGNGLLNKETGDYMPFTVKKGDYVLFSSYAGTSGTCASSSTMPTTASSRMRCSCRSRRIGS